VAGALGDQYDGMQLYTVAHRDHDDAPDVVEIIRFDNKLTWPVGRQRVGKSCRCAKQRNYCKRRNVSYHIFAPAEERKAFFFEKKKQKTFISKSLFASFSSEKEESSFTFLARPAAQPS
jgi:hypothetical protein